jgi:ribonuclease P protein component
VMPVFTTLSNSRQYREVLNTGRRARRDGVVVTCAPNDRGGSRVGLVAKAGKGRAVARNRARRRLREAVGAVAPRGGFDIVIAAGPEAEGMDFQQLVRNVREALQEAGVRCA